MGIIIVKKPIDLTDELNTARDNIVVNAFRIAICDSITVMNYIDGIVDIFSDQTGVDDVASMGEDYDADLDYYHPAGAVDLTPNVYGHWCLNESSGTNAPDTSGNNRHGTLINMEDGDWVSGKLNNCLSFDGTNEYVTCGNIANFERTDPFSVEFLAKTSDDAGQNSNIGKFDITPGRGWLSFFYAGDAYFILRNNADTNRIDVKFTFDYHDNAYHHFIWTYDGSSTAAGVKLYIDNVERTLTASYDNLTDTILNTNEVEIGAYDGTQTFDGLQDEIVIYDKKLNATEVGFRFNSGAGTEATSSGGGDMSLISEDFTAETQPDEGRIVILEQDVDVITENTDIKSWISRDGGTTYSQVTLVDEGDFDTTSRLMIGSIDISSQPAGVSMKWKLTTHNDKNLNILGVGLLWQ